MSKILPHPFQAGAPGTTWCVVCNTERDEFPGLHTRTEAMSAHTPGPWQVSNDNVVHNGEARVAKVLKPRGWESDDEANARLIAAAPELLEALRLLVSDLEIAAAAANLPLPTGHTRALYTIAKAEGRDQ